MCITLTNDSTTAIDSVTSKLGALSMQLDNLPQNNGANNTGGGTTVTIDVHATTDENTSIKAQLVGIKPSGVGGGSTTGSGSSSSDFAQGTSLAGGTRGVTDWQDSKRRGQRAGGRFRATTANTPEVLEQRRRMGLA